MHPLLICESLNHIKSLLSLFAHQPPAPMQPNLAGEKHTILLKITLKSWLWTSAELIILPSNYTACFVLYIFILSIPILHLHSGSFHTVFFSDLGHLHFLALSWAWSATAFFLFHWGHWFFFVPFSFSYDPFTAVNFCVLVVTRDSTSYIRSQKER